MQGKKQRILGRVLVSIAMLTTISNSENTKINITTMGVKPEIAKIASTSTSYQHMSTKELEHEVERLTISGNVPFEMGVELMKRWTKG